MNVITRGIRNAFRNVIRTFSLVVIIGLSIGLSLAMLVAHQAVGSKIASVKASVGNTVSISPAGARGFQGGGTPLTETELAKVKSLAHVTALSESLSDQLTSSNSNLVSAIAAGSLGERFAKNDGNTATPPAGAPGTASGSGGTTAQTFTPPVTLVGTTSPENLSTDSAQGGGTFTLKSGKVFASTSTDNVALVGSTLATKNNLKVGSTFTAYGATITVAGIFDAGNTFSNNQVIMPLAAVQKLSGQTGDITSATATIDSITNVPAATTAVEKVLGSAADVTNAAAQAQTAIAPLQNVQAISLYSLFGAVIAGAVIILLTMVMIVRERRREIGVLKAIGASNLKVMGQFVAESITLTIIGAVVGIVIGVVAGNPITKLLVNNSTSTTSGMPGAGGPGGGRAMSGLHNAISNIQGAVGFSIIGYGLLVAIIIAILGSAFASLLIARVRPAEVMRAE